MNSFARSILLAGLLLNVPGAGWGLETDSFQHFSISVIHGEAAKMLHVQYTTRAGCSVDLPANRGRFQLAQLGNSWVARGGEYKRLEAYIPIATVVADRVYQVAAPVAGVGTMVYLPYFIPSPNACGSWAMKLPGLTRRGTVPPIDSNSESAIPLQSLPSRVSTGYLLLTESPSSSKNGFFASDKLPGRLTELVEESVSRYAHIFGITPGKDFFVVSTENTQLKQALFHGDVAGLIVRLSFGGRAVASDETAILRSQVAMFVSHELAHLIQSDGGRRRSAIETEGGAEFLSVLAGFITGDITDEEADQRLGSALNSCLLASRAFSYNTLVSSRSYGRLPYECGVALMLADVNLGELKTSISRSDIGKYVLPSSRLVDEFVSGGSKSFYDQLRGILVSKSFISSKSSEEADLRRTDGGLSSELFSLLVEANCGPTAGHWTLKESVRIEDSIVCQTFPPAFEFDRVEGVRIASNPRGVLRMLNDACSSGVLSIVIEGPSGSVFAPLRSLCNDVSRLSSVSAFEVRLIRQLATK
jgi:hypothetical protein